MRPRIASRSRDDVGGSRAAVRPVVPCIESLESRQLLSGSKIAPPVAPTNLQATPDGRAPVIRLTWSDNSSKEGGYVVERKHGRTASWVIIATLPANTTYYRDARRLAIATGYAYTVAAFNRGGRSAFTPVVTAVTSAAGAPVIDGTFQSGGNVMDVGRGLASRVAVSPDGGTVYAVSNEGTGNQVGYVGPLVDGFETGSGAATAFPPAGLKVNASLPSAIGAVTGLAVQPDGKLIVAGDVADGTHAIAVARFNPDGSLDTSFAGGAGELVAQFGDQEVVEGVALAADGSIYVGGDDGDEISRLHQQFFAVRLHADGTVDRGYGVNGIAQGDRQPQPTGYGEIGYELDASAMAIDPTDGSVVMVGSTGIVDDNAVAGRATLVGARLLPDGTATDTFSYGDPSTAGAAAIGVTVAPDGKIVVVGTAAYAALSWRFNPDGTPDTTWVGPGTVVRPDDTAEGFAFFRAIAPLADGSYVVVGDRVQDGDDGLVAHLRASDGALIGSITFHPSSSLFADVAVAPDDSLFAGGYANFTLLVSKFRIG